MDALIDAAIEACGSAAALSRRIKVHPSNISAWRAGTRSVPMGDVILMAKASGVPPFEWLRTEILQHYEGTEKWQLLDLAMSEIERDTIF